MRMRSPALAAAVLAAACNAPRHRLDLPMDPAVDLHSCARPAQVAVTHLDLDLDLDFAQRVASGTATLLIQRHDPTAPLWLDTDGLEIADVRGADGRPLAFDFAAPDPILGRPLAVRLAPDTVRVAIRYRTRPDAKALQWLAPEQTAGQKQPFLFTQGQAILTRSWIPLQDSPAVRQTWSARIRAPHGLSPVMSAMERKAQPDGAVHFAMRNPVPSYLIALACGDLQRRDLSPRVAIWAEPPVLPGAAAELADTETMVAACESLFGPYRWGRYDVLVLPPSFPFGGMENPCLTFATPTILAGDKSLVALIAHELAHSWSGNLVTNATWRDFWLNEGCTVFLEQRIMEHVFGPKRAEMEIQLGMQGLAKEMAELPDKDRILHIDLAGRNPDDGMTAVPYEKGAAFLRRLQEVFGRASFDAFLRDYFAAHSFRSITTADFEQFLRAKLFAKDPAKAAQIDVDAWLRQPGLPADAPVPRSAEFAAVDAARTAFLDSHDGARLRAQTSGWTTQHWLHFLEGLPAATPPTPLRALDAELHFTASRNAEILTAWLQIAIRSDLAEAAPRVEEFLGSVGRRKFLVPLYKALLAAPGGKARALAIYATARPRYHAVAQRTLDELLGWTAR
jgi:aminopeptidase N